MRHRPFFKLFCPAMCLFLRSCSKGPQSPMWVCATHTNPRAALAMVVQLPASAGWKLPSYKQPHVSSQRRWLLVKKEDILRDLTHWFDVLGNKKGKTGFSPHQKWVRAGPTSTDMRLSPASCPWLS